MYIMTLIWIKIKTSVNIVHEKTFRSDLSKQIKKLLFWRITYYKLVFSGIYLYLVALLEFFYDFFLLFGQWCQLVLVLFHFVLFLSQIETNW